MSKAVVLFSGGQDSTTCLALARTKHSDITAVSIYYGQRHASELGAARQICQLLNVKHEVLEIPAFGQLGGSALVDSSLPLAGSGGIPDQKMPEGLPTSFVPARNALLLTLAAAVAVREGARIVYSGVCQTDYSGYPDCRREFIDALETALTLGMPSSVGPILIETPLMRLTKAESVQLAMTLPDAMRALALSVTCYEGRRPGCGQCPACALRARGFAEAGVLDPSAA